MGLLHTTPRPSPLVVILLGVTASVIFVARPLYGAEKESWLDSLGDRVEHFIDDSHEGERKASSICANAHGAAVIVCFMTGLAPEETPHEAFE